MDTSDIPAPTGRRPSTSRPSSTATTVCKGFPSPLRVTETAHKLGEDAGKLASRLRSEASTPDQGTTPPAAFVASVMNAAEMWRTAFHAEAMECVKAMAAVVEGRDAGILRSGAIRPEDCRRAELKASAMMQQHVKEMMRLNEALNDFLADSRASGNLLSFTDSLSQLMRLNTHVDEQRTRWEDLDSKMNRMQQDIHEVRSLLIEKHNESHGALQQTAASVTAGQEMLEKKLHEVHEDHVSSMQELFEKLRSNGVTQLEATRTLMDDALSSPNALSASLTELQSKVSEIEVIARKETGDLRSEVATLKENLEHAEGQGATWKASLDQATADLTSLRESAKQLSEQLGGTQVELEVARSRAIDTSLLQLKQVESRGNVKLNRETGALDVLRPVEFTPCQPADGKPSPRLAEPDAAGVVLEDVASVIKLFDTTTDVEVQLKEQKGLKAPADFFAELGDASAGVIQAALLERGASPERLKAKGAAGKRGVSANSIAVKLHGEYFSSNEGGAKKGGGRGGGRGRAK
mmetsp:Transcript_50477/g.117844  ORF Transcript_50477/g.117844 Transcript_50477/m.117844 type:complete len:522 (-) Transcript_50477:45-1610(-)